MNEAIFCGFRPIPKMTKKLAKKRKELLCSYERYEYAFPCHSNYVCFKINHYTIMNNRGKPESRIFLFQ